MPLLLAALSTLLAQGLRTEAYYVGIREALDPLYRLEHDEAIKRLSTLGAEFPEHPGPPLAEAAVMWLRELFRRQELDDLDRFISPGYFTQPASREMPEEEVERFSNLIAESQRRAELVEERDPGSRDARYYLGSAEGILGAYAITIGRSKLDALRHGKKAYEYQKSIVDEDPAYYDAYMTVGTYEYILDNLPWYVKWVAVLVGYRGSEKLGFEYLVRAAEHGRFVEIDARVLLMVLYVRERSYEHALTVARDLHRLFPENFLFHLNEGQILEKMGESAKALDVYLDVERLAAEERPNYQKLPLGSFRYTLGLELLEAGRHEAALERFERVAAEPDTPARERALSHLRAGEILDILGRREKALRRYRDVLELEDIEGSHDAAKRRMKQHGRS